MNGRNHKKRFTQKKATMVLLIFAAVIGISLWLRYESNVLGTFPFLIFILICPLMHFFLHKGHGGHDHHHHQGHDEQSHHKGKEEASGQKQSENNHES